MNLKRSVSVLLCTVAAMLSAGAELVGNGSFAGGLKPWSQCAWTPNPGRWAVEEGALKITHDNVKQRTNFVQGVKLKPRTTYRIAFRMKCADVLASNGGGAQLYVLLNSKTTVFRAAVTGKFKNASGTFDWKEGAFSFTTPEQGGRYELYLQMMAATGSVWFKDIRLCEAEQESAKKLSLRFYPAKFQGNIVNIAAGMPQTLLGEFFAAPADAAGMKLELDLPEDIRFIGSCPWWWNEKNKFTPDPVSRSSVTRKGVKYNRYTITLEKQLLRKLRKDTLLWKNLQRVFLAAGRSTKDGTGYFRLRSPRAGVSEEVAVRFKILPPLKKFEPTTRFTLGITDLDNLSAPFPEVRKASWDLLFSLSRRPMTSPIFAWGKLPEELRRRLVDKTCFVMMTGDWGLGAWRRKNNWQEFRKDEGNGPTNAICPTHAAEDFNSPYWQKFWLEKLRGQTARAHRIDCIEWDIEPMQVCRCPLCRDRFSKELKLDHTATVAEVKGKYAAAYFQFRVRQNGRMIRNFARLVRVNFPKSKVGIVTDNLHAAPPHVASWCGVDIRQFDDVFDVMRNMPYYSGLTYFDDFAFNVKTLKTPQFPLNDPGENLEQFYVRYTPESLHMNMVATAALGGKGFAVYPWELLDGAYYHTLQKSSSAISRAEEYYARRGRSGAAVPKNVHKVEREDNGKKRFALIPDLDSVLRVLVHEIPGKGRLLTVFNYAAADRMILEIPAQGTFRAVRDLETGEHYAGVDGSKPFLAALEPQSVKLLEFSCRALPADGEKVVTQTTLNEELRRFFDAKSPAQLHSRRSGKFFAGWGVGSTGGAVAELSDGVSAVGFAPGKNGTLVSWRRDGKEIVERPGKGMLDEWLFVTVNETVVWRVTRFAALPDRAEVTFEAELPPPRNAAPDMVSLQGLKLKKTAVLRKDELVLRGEIVNPGAHLLNFSFRVRNYPQMSLPWKILSEGVRYDGEGTVAAWRSGRSIPIPVRCLNDRYDGAPFEIATPDGILSIHAPAADGVMVWNGGSSPSTVEPCYAHRTLGPGQKFSFESRLKWRR